MASGQLMGAQALGTVAAAMQPVMQITRERLTAPAAMVNGDRWLATALQVSSSLLHSSSDAGAGLILKPAKNLN